MEFLKSNVFLAALLGSFGTLIVQIIIRYQNDKRYSTQVKNMILESSRRVRVYLEHMIKEPKEVAIENLESRIKGIEIIQQLLSEMELSKIPSKDIFVMYRTREQIHEIVDDLSMFRDNHFKLREFENEINSLLINNIDSNVNEYSDILNEYKRKDEEHYERLSNDLERYIELLKSTKNNYNTIKKAIYKINKLN